MARQQNDRDAKDPRLRARNTEIIRRMSELSRRLAEMPEDDPEYAELAGKVLSLVMELDFSLLRTAGGEDEPRLERGWALDELSQASLGEVQKIAASQIRILDTYHATVLQQASMSFRAALVAAVIGLLFFLAAVAFLLMNQPQGLATVTVIGGALVEVISGINFWLYGKTTTQLADFHDRLDRTQRFLLANSICESLTGKNKETARRQLVNTIATVGFGPVGPTEAATDTS